MIEYIKHNNIELAIIIRSNYQRDYGIEFVTPSHYSQQLGYMKREADYIIEPHVHNSLKREVHYTKEVLLIKKGKIRVDFYSENKKYIKSNILNSGDVILLSFGGHGFYFIEESEIIEVKQGPYAEEKDKTKFNPVKNNKIKL